MRCPAIGLTGDAGSGKSRILGWLAEQGASCTDADGLVRELLTTDLAVMTRVAERFGPDLWVAGERASLDRGRLAERVFDRREALADLEGILHPRVTERLQDWIARARDAEPPPVALAVEAVKLLEAALPATLHLDQVWLVVCDLDERLKRLERRGWSLDEARRRAEALNPLAWRLERTDVVIDTSSAWEATVPQLRVAWSQLLGARAVENGAASVAEAPLGAH